MMLEKIFRLDHKVVVITGAGGLLGQKHAEAVACYGGIPILLDLSKSKVSKLADELKSKYNIDSKGYKVDITNESEVESAVKKIIKRFGKIDCLVNNAANNPKVEVNDKVNFSRLENFPINLWNDDISVGLTGSFLCAKYFGYQISLNPAGGSIVNISSDLGLISPDQRLYAENGVEEKLQAVKPVSYSVVKSGIIGLSRYLATYWADKNVRCNTLCPGGVNNNQPEEFLNEIVKRIPMSRMANVNEYQGVLVWMLSDASSYLNGAVIPVDGGRTSW